MCNTGVTCCLARRNYGVVTVAWLRCHGAGVFLWAMSYNLTLQCGCIVYVACDPRTGLAHTRILEARGSGCPSRKHEIGLRLYLWELLPDPAYRTRPVFIADAAPVTVI